MGTTCTPTAPGCLYADTCPATDPSVAEACINFCAPVFEGPIVDDAVFCALDECDQLLFTERSDIWRCPPTNTAGQQYVCEVSHGTPDPARIGVCRAARGVLDLCFFSFFADPTTCEAGSYCVDVSACPTQRMHGQRLAVPDGQDFCWLPAREGEPCDSNLGRGTHGCSPCEWGTWCRDTPTYGPICMRACATPDEPTTARPDLCACTSAVPCQAYADIAPPDPAFPVQAGEPSIYCTPLFVPNGNQCRLQGVPCGDTAARCQETEQALLGTVSICCRDDGAACTSASDCCEGRSTCVGGTCTACGREGENATTAGCCPGYVLVGQTCRSCAVSREGRQRALAEGASCEGEFVRFEAGAAQATFAVPLRGNTGAGAPELGTASSPLTAAQYRLRPQHRLFLMEGDLASDGVMTPDRFVHLPASDPAAGVRSFDLTAFPAGPIFSSMRVYDGGACGEFAPWDIIITGLTAGLNRFLVEPQWGAFGSTPLTLQQADITPILRSGTGTFARSVESDQVNLTLEYQAVDGSAFGCSNGRLRLLLGVRIVRDPALLPTEAGELDDRWLTRLQTCSDPADPDVEDCECQCIPERERYACWRWCDEHSLTPGQDTFALPRSVRAVRDAFDYRPELVFLDGGLVDCELSGLNDWLTGFLANRLRWFLPGVLAGLTSGLDVALPSPSLGIAWEDMAPCGRVDLSGETFPSQFMCSEAPSPFGGRRTVCQGFDAARQPTDSAPVEYRCAILRTEVRRINVRPDGIEVVLVDSATDPQHRLIQTTRPEACNEARAGAVRAIDLPNFGTFDVTNSPLVSLFPAQSRRRICHPDDGLTRAADGSFIGCAGACGDTVGFNSRLLTGTPCTFVARGINYCGDPDHPELCREPSGDRCYVVPNDDGHDERGAAACCRPESFCNIPREGGGMRYFGSDSVPAQPADYWRCVEYPDRDPWACGGCGNVCAPDQPCCDSACRDLQTDAAHCGRCGNACAPGAACARGACCGAGEVVCAGACADLASSSSHCGACGSRCERGAHCSAGSCCPDGQEHCDGACIDVLDDRTNCGACGRTCHPLFQHCSSGMCCSFGFVNCGDGCRSEDDLAIDRNHCGSCGNACGPREACIGGRCVR